MGEREEIINLAISSFGAKTMSSLVHQSQPFSSYFTICLAFGSIIQHPFLSRDGVTFPKKVNKLLLLV